LRYDNGLYDGQDSIDDPPFRAMVTSLWGDEDIYLLVVNCDDAIIQESYILFLNSLTLSV
jgi:hypothetical protein